MLKKDWERERERGSGDPVEQWFANEIIADGLSNGKNYPMAK